MSKLKTAALLLSLFAKPAYEDYKNLSARKKEMEEVGLEGGDNYYHRLGMCENAQKGLPHVLTSLGGGIIKEADDLRKKTKWSDFLDNYDGFKKSIGKHLDDSKKDMENNIEGLYYGLTNPDKDCKIWLNDLDYKHNVWKNKK